MLLMFGAPIAMELIIIALVVGLPTLTYFLAAFMILKFARNGRRDSEVAQLRRRVEDLEQEVRRSDRED